MEEPFVLSGGPEIDIPDAKLSFGAALQKALALSGEKTVQVCALTGTTTNGYELLALTTRLAEILQAQGVGPGDVIALSSENRVEFTVVAIATLFVGATIAPINITYSPDEIQHAFNLSKPKMLFCSPVTVEVISKEARKTTFIKRIVVFGNTSPVKGVVTLKTFVADSSVPAGSDFPVTPVDPVTQTAAIMCSSGTTGLPKGVELTHLNMTVCAEHLRKWFQVEGRLDDGETMLGLLPWFHAFGFTTHLSMIVIGVKLVVIPMFEETLFLKSIQDYKVTVIFVVPPLCVFFGKHPMVDKYDLSSLRILISGAAPLGKDVQDAVMKRINVCVRQGYGLTETTLAMLIAPAGENNSGSSGKLEPGTLAKVIDLETGKNLGPNKEGELCFSGPLIMKGYIGNKNATDAMIDAKGWLHTGDIGYYDENENFYVVERLKELIKYKGFQVPPAELEALLLTHPGVKDAAVIGIPDERCGELPLAYVVRQPNSKVTEKELIDFVAKKRSPAKRLHGGARFVEEIPKNASGKILRRELRELAKKQATSKL